MIYYDFRWIRETLEMISKSYSEKEKQNFNIPYLENALQRIPQQISDSNELAEFHGEIALTINSLPRKIEGNRFRDKDAFQYLQEWEKIENLIQKKYGYVRKGYYKFTCLLTGVLIGLLLGLFIGYALNNIFIVTPIFILISVIAGITIGNQLDMKAEKELRVL